MKCWPLLLLISVMGMLSASAQTLTYSDVSEENTRDMNFEILGKVNGNFMVFKNQRAKYAISIYRPNMELKDRVELDFIPDKTFNVEYVVYPTQLQLIYQYQKRSIVYCMGARLDSNAQIIGEPVLLDTTRIGGFGDNKIYSVMASEDKKFIQITKVQKEGDYFLFGTKLYSANMELVKQSRLSLENVDRRDVYSEFLLDNEGNMVFTKAYSSNNRDDLDKLDFVLKPAMSETFKIMDARLKKKMYVDEMKIKIDNINKNYLLTSFYFNERKGNIKGLYNAIWKWGADTAQISIYNELDDSVRMIAKTKGSLKSAFDDFFIRSVVLKKDGGFILVAEDHVTEGSSLNNFNRYDYLYNSPYSNPYYYNYYSPYSSSFYYNPFNNGSQNRVLRYYYFNLLILSFNKEGILEWNNVVNKEQYSDSDDSYLSYSSFTVSGVIHFLFNDERSRNQLLSDNLILPNGEFKRNPTIKSHDNGTLFMPRYAKQTGARQVFMPCSYRDKIFFARIDF